MSMIYPPPPTNVLVETMCQEKTEVGVQTSLKKASANKDVQTVSTKSRHTSTQAFNKKNVMQLVQTDEKKKNVTQYVQTYKKKNNFTQSVQTDDGGWQKVGANKNKHHNVIAKKSKEEFSLRDDNPFKVLGEQNNTSAIY